MVIAIISLLVSILLPSLSRANELAKRITCLANIKQIGLCVVYYVDDCGRYMGADEYGVRWSFYDYEQHFTELLKPYTDHSGSGQPGNYNADNHSKIFQCPNDPLGNNEGFEFMYHGSSYSFTKQFQAAVPESPQPCNCEAYLTNSHVWWEYHMRTQPDTDSPLYACYGVASTGHNDTWPILFIDQHAEPIASEDISRTYNWNGYYW